jgi:SAM-dependent methyltransferase
MRLAHSSTKELHLDEAQRSVNNRTVPLSSRERLLDERRRVLNVGSGPRTSRSLHPAFSAEAWNEVRLDIEPSVEPDLVGSVTSLGSLLSESSVDAVWASHVMEHLFRHEVDPALRQVFRVLKEDGFAIFTSPDIAVAVDIAARFGMDHVIYHSPAGPITAHDMIFGHSASIAAGRLHMAHKTAFTRDSLGQSLLVAGFPTVIAKVDRYDLWAVALMERADEGAILEQLAIGGLDFRA